MRILESENLDREMRIKLLSELNNNHQRTKMHKTLKAISFIKSIHKKIILALSSM